MTNGLTLMSLIVHNVSCCFFFRKSLIMLSKFRLRICLISLCFYFWFYIFLSFRLFGFSQRLTIDYVNVSATLESTNKIPCPWKMFLFYFRDLGSYPLDIKIYTSSRFLFMISIRNTPTENLKFSIFIIFTFK